MGELTERLPKSGSVRNWNTGSQENYKGTGRYDTRRKKKEIISHNNIVRNDAAERKKRKKDGVFLISVLLLR